MSSYIHSCRAVAAGGALEDRPGYQNGPCFDNCPLPAFDTPESQALQARIADLAEQFDAHRTCQQAAHPGLTLTGIYKT